MAAAASVHEGASSLSKTEARTGLQEENFTLAALDGYNLAATLLSPAADVVPRYLVLMLSATGMRRPFYRAFAHFIVRRCQARLLLFDFRGIGDSAPATLRFVVSSCADEAPTQLFARS